MRDRSKQLLVINTGKKQSEQTGMTSQSGTTHIIGGGGLSVNISDYLLKSIWDKVFEIRTDSQGTEYIFGKLPVVTQSGITMYSGDGVDVPSLASGLPFDGRTIWYNPDTQQIEVIGGTGGGSGEGVSNFWDLSGIPSWITNTKPKYTYSEIEGTPDLSKYALASQIPSLSGYATESWVLQKNYATKATTLSGYGITDAYTKTNVDDLLKSYVTLGGRQTITGEKNFTGGLKVNDSPIYYDTEKKYWKLEGDLLVTGGVTMYGSDSSFTPSTIMDAILYDDATLGINSNGELYVKGGTSGGGIDITALQNYLTSNSYLNVTSGDNRYLKLSGGDLSGNIFINTYASNRTAQSYIRFNKGSEYFGMGASAYNISIFSLGTVNSDNTWKKEAIQFNDNGTVNFLTTPTVDSNIVLHAGNYSFYALPLSGGTISNNGYALILNRESESPVWIQFRTQNEFVGAIGGENGSLRFMDKNSKVNTVWHSGNFNPSNYLPLSGGTITVESGTIFDATFGKDIFGYNPSYGVYIGSTYNDGNSYWIYSGCHNNPNPLFNKDGELCTIWHSGNDGSGSGLDADLLDGQEGSWYIRNVLTFQSNDGAGVKGGKDLNSLTYGIVSNYGSSDFWANAPTGMKYGMVLNLKSSLSNDLMGQLAWDINHHGTDSTRYLYWRANDDRNFATAKWHQIAFTDSNVASATKLQTARTIWGQSFDGTGNVSGHMTLTTGFDAGGVNMFLVTDNVYVGSIWYSSVWRGKTHTFDMNGLTAMTILDNGNVGIGTTSPVYKLDVRESTNTDYGLHYYNSANKCSFFVGGGALWYGNANTGNSLLVRIQGGTVTDGSGGIVALDLTGNGNLKVAGGITMYSDQRKKTILNYVELSLKQIANAPLIEHYYNNDDAKTTHVGSIAQYWASMNDWFCKLDSEGFYTMEIQNAALASAISIARELDRYETKTDKAIKKLKKRICELEEEVERLKSA